jgi:SH3-like domain-containing protein
MKNSVYENSLLSILLTFYFFILYGCHTVFDAEKQFEIDSIAKRWVPDNREGICKVSVEIGKRGTLILRGETTIPEVREDIIKTLSKRDIKLIDSILILPDAIKNEKFRGVVSISVINLRKQPAHTSELVSQAIMGTPVMVLKSENSWLLIQTPDRYIAWTEKSSVTLMTGSEMASWKKADKLIFIENSGLVFESPDESGIVGDLVAGSVFIKIADSQDWVKIILPDGREGFVRAKEVMDFNSWKGQPPCKVEDICRSALTFIGLPYLWGGSSTKAVDCSGFVQSVYFINGIILSRDASLQAIHGDDIDLSDGFSRLGRGDLLFFGSKDSIGSHVTHVAIYMGNSEYIHSSGRVMINSLDSTRNNYNSQRKNSFLFARRIIGTNYDTGIVPVNEHPWY